MKCTKLGWRKKVNNLFNTDINDLLANMTLQEKIGQLTQLLPNFIKSSAAGAITGPMLEMGITKENINNVGSVLATTSAEEVIEIQKVFLENNKKKIPLMFMADVIHGFRTIFPIPLAIGCSWDMELAEKVAEISAREAASAGISVTFSPMVDLVRDPRWGRVMESTGEDPYLNSLFGRAFVRGYQGQNLMDKDRIAACVKHFAAYGAPEGGREYNTVDMSERVLREYYLPSYKAALDEGSRMLMTSFNTVDGIPASGNKYLMKDILRDEWSFDGVVISDWAAVLELMVHGVAEGKKEAAKLALEAEVDIEMMTSCYVEHAEELIKEGKINIDQIDRCVYRILKLKEELGLFEDPYRGVTVEREKKVLLCEEHRKSAREIAAASMVLLKNEGILPLSRDKKIAVIGPLADNKEILGFWICTGKAEEAVTLKEGLIDKVAKENILYSKGCGITDGTDEELEEAVVTAKAADIVILALGEKHEKVGEGASRANIELEGRQMELTRRILELKKPTVAVLFNGRPLDIRELMSTCPAVLEAWFPGTEGGNAVSDIIFGDVNPSGRLTMSFPYALGQIPVYYNNLNTGRPKLSEDNDKRFVSAYMDIPNSPLLPFGFGLSYSKFEYNDFKLDKVSFSKGEVIKASVIVRNSGSFTGVETVQLYIRDLYGSVVRPLKELKSFKRVKLAPGEEQVIEFEIKDEMLRFYNSKLEYKSEPGKFRAMVGRNSVELNEIEFELV
jgi:beta-glucosidase